MAEEPHIRAVGSPIDVGYRYYRHCAILDALLTTSHREPQSSDYSVQSPALAVPLARYQRQEDYLLAHYGRIMLPIPNRWPIPVVC